MMMIDHKMGPISQKSSKEEEEEKNFGLALSRPRQFVKFPRNKGMNFPPRLLLSDLPPGLGNCQKSLKTELAS